MKSNKEMRAEAREILRNGWFWRLLIVGVMLNLVCYGVQGLVGVGFMKYGIDAKSVPAFVFQLFISYIFGAILAFGLAGAMLKATVNDGIEWFSSSFGGFSRPLEVAWLLVLMNLRVLLWSLLLIVPGLIAVYRYRQTWYLKSQHPDWSAWKCLGESGKMMDGYKWQACVFDCSYIGWMLLVGLAFGCSIALATAGRCSAGALTLVGSVLGVLSFWLLCYVGVYFLVGRAVFYRELEKAVAG